MPFYIGIFGWIGGILLLVFKFLLSLLKLIGKAVAEILLFLIRIGLLLPLLYGLFGLVLYLLQMLTPNSAEATWYLIGLLPVFLLSVIFAVRKRNRRKKKEQEETEESYRQFQKQSEKKTEGEPIVYRSVNHPDIVIYEYPDRMEQYREIDGKLVLTERREIRKR